MNKNSHPRFTNTLFSSIEPFRNSSDLFPSHDRRIGISASCGYHPEEKCVMVLIEEERPSFVSTSVGEYVQPNEAEAFLRQSISEIAKSCRRTANELLDHAERLEKLTKQNSPILPLSQIDKEEDHKTPNMESVKFTKQVYPRPAQAQPHRARVQPPSQSLDLDDI
jgi:hypothetical protein